MIYVGTERFLGHVMGLKRSVERDKVTQLLCEVCRKRLADTIVVDFIFACAECAAKIETAIRDV